LESSARRLYRFVAFCTLASLLPGAVLGASPARSLLFHAHSEHDLHVHLVDYRFEAGHGRHAHKHEHDPAPSDSDDPAGPWESTWFLEAADPGWLLRLDQTLHARRASSASTLTSPRNVEHTPGFLAMTPLTECRPPPAPSYRVTYSSLSLPSAVAARLLLLNHAFLL
jgi:hypothetical protein